MTTRQAQKIEADYITLFSASTFNQLKYNYTICTDTYLSFDAKVYKENKLIAILESKVRKNKYLKYSTLYLEKYKYNQLLKYSEQYKVPAYYFCFFENSNTLIHFNISKLPNLESTWVELPKCSTCHNSKPVLKEVLALPTELGTTLQY